jgi:hypothetical protein
LARCFHPTVSFLKAVAELLSTRRTATFLLGWVQDDVRGSAAVLTGLRVKFCLVADGTTSSSGKIECLHGVKV